MSTSTCSEPGCGQFVMSKGYCRKHYKKYISRPKRKEKDKEAIKEGKLKEVQAKSSSDAVSAAAAKGFSREQLEQIFLAPCKTEQDLKNFKGNKNNSGFLPQERDWLSQLIEKQGVVDVYRHLYPNTTDECYTWWSNRGQAYAKNVGWRLDYQLATAGIANAALSAEIYKEEKFSDHAPLIMQYEKTAFGI